MQVAVCPELQHVQAHDLNFLDDHKSPFPNNTLTSENLTPPWLSVGTLLRILGLGLVLWVATCM